jgi:uncharacterized protein (UPF0333 family)
MIISFIVGVVVGFVAGLLVFRNNAKKADSVVSEAEAKAKELIEKARNRK